MPEETPTHMETSGNEQDTENIPKKPHPEHLRYSKPRQNNPVSNGTCQGKFPPAQREPQPCLISIIPPKSILLGQQVGIHQFLVDLEELRGFGLGSSGSAQPPPKASREKQEGKGTKSKRNKEKSARFQCINSTQLWDGLSRMGVKAKENGKWWS